MRAYPARRTGGYDPIMAAEDVVTSDAVELDPADAEEIVPDERKKTGVWKHPDHLAIEHCLRVGKSPEWIAAWLEDQYPDPADVDDEDFDDDDYEEPDYTAAQAQRWRLSAKTIEDYRARWMPECTPGVDVVDEELEDFIGRKLPAARGEPWEIQVLEFGIQVAEHNLLKSLKADENLGMLTQTSLEANDRMIQAAKNSAALKSQLGRPGYEIVPERHQVDANVNTHNTKLNIELHGRVKPDGTIEPGEPDKLNLARKLLEAPPEERERIIAAAEATTPEADDAGGADA